MNTKNSKFNEKRDDLFCKYCNKQLPTVNSLKQHECRCKFNDCGKIIESGFKIAMDKGWDPSWNRGLTKETDDRVRNCSEKISKWVKETGGSFKNKHHTEEVRNKISNTMREKGLGGICKRKLIEYNGEVLESTYEYITAKSLDENNIKWEKCKYKFNYYDINNNKHSYKPDFYLPDYDVYLDPKNDYLINMINPKLGYKDIDKIRWVCNQNNINVIVLNKNNLTWDKIQNLI